MTTSHLTIGAVFACFGLALTACDADSHVLNAPDGVGGPTNNVSPPDTNRGLDGSTADGATGDATSAAGCSAVSAIGDQNVVRVGSVTAPRLPFGFAFIEWSCESRELVLGLGETCDPYRGARLTFLIPVDANGTITTVAAGPNLLGTGIEVGTGIRVRFAQSSGLWGTCSSGAVGEVDLDSIETSVVPSRFTGAFALDNLPNCSESGSAASNVNGRFDVTLPTRFRDACPNAIGDGGVVRADAAF